MAHFAFLLLSHLNLVQAGVISELEAFALVRWRWWGILIEDGDQWSMIDEEDADENNDKDTNDNEDDDPPQPSPNWCHLVLELEAYALV